jgi:DNA-binding MarR family transcriptional regulator
MRQEFPSQFERPEQSPGFQLWRAANHWQAHMRRTLAPLGLTHVQFVILAVTAWLTRNSQPVTQIQVAEAAAIDPMMNSQVIRSLEARGLLTRTPDPEDRRARRLTLTETGRYLAAEALQRVEAADAEFFGTLGADAVQLAPLLGRLAAREEDSRLAR